MTVRTAHIPSLREGDIELLLLARCYMYSISCKISMPVNVQPAVSILA